MKKIFIILAFLVIISQVLYARPAISNFFDSSSIHAHYKLVEILKKIGKKSIVKTSYQPFAFFYEYNIAAKMSDELPVYSEKTINFLKKLESKYKGN